MRYIIIILCLVCMQFLIFRNYADYRFRKKIKEFVIVSEKIRDGQLVVFNEAKTPDEIKIISNLSLSKFIICPSFIKEERKSKSNFAPKNRRY